MCQNGIAGSQGPQLCAALVVRKNYDVGGWIMESILERVLITCGRRQLAKEMKAKWWEGFRQKEQGMDGADVRAQAARASIDKLETAQALKSVEKPSFKNIFGEKNTILRGEKVRGVKKKMPNSKKAKSKANMVQIYTTSTKRKASEWGGTEMNLENEAAWAKRLKLVQPKIKLYFGAGC